MPITTSPDLLRAQFDDLLSESGIIFDSEHPSKTVAPSVLGVRDFFSLFSFSWVRGWFQAKTDKDYERAAFVLAYCALYGLGSQSAVVRL